MTRIAHLIQKFKKKVKDEELVPEMKLTIDQLWKYKWLKNFQKLQKFQKQLEIQISLDPVVPMNDDVESKRHYRSFDYNQDANIVLFPWESINKCQIRLGKLEFRIAIPAHFGSTEAPTLIVIPRPFTPWSDVNFLVKDTYFACLCRIGQDDIDTIDMKNFSQSITVQVLEYTWPILEKSLVNFTCRDTFDESLICLLFEYITGISIMT